jgi:hypothetical protein
MKRVMNTNKIADKQIEKSNEDSPIVLSENSIKSPGANGNRYSLASNDSDKIMNFQYKHESTYKEQKRYSKMKLEESDEEDEPENLI